LKQKTIDQTYIFSSVRGGNSSNNLSSLEVTKLEASTLDSKYDLMGVKILDTAEFKNEV